MKKGGLWRVAFIVVLDILLIILAGGAALWIRFDFTFVQIPHERIVQWAQNLPLQIVMTIFVFALTRMYSFVWRAVGAHDVARIVFATVTAFCTYVLCSAILQMRMPGSVLVISLIVQIAAFTVERTFLRFYESVRRFLGMKSQKSRERIMIIGAGEAGRMLLREVATDDHIHAKVYCLIDDNPKKWGRYLEGVRIIGGRDEIIPTAKKFSIDRIIFAIPTATAAQRREVLNICKDTGCKVQHIPGIYQMVNNTVSMAAVQDIQVEDLLGREPIKLELEVLHEFLGNKTVLVTGGGGSIGSELCRQIAQYHPKQLILLDIYENNAYDIQQELLRTYGSKLNLQVEIASVRDKEKIDLLFERYRPQVVFHAAAHKHVPLMEHCPEEAIKNNVFGTYNVICAAEKYSAQKFVMISTDKAVNPTNLMGATKRFCELILQSRPQSNTEFCAVRFGNVLGSNGSVVPLFQKQIQHGGPVTITDKRIIRYFMTIPEAAQLVLDAGAMAKHNQIFVLDMGEPVKILQLAENMIRLYGMEPYTDIEIREIGLRPGEKLYEELLISGEELSKTSNEKIFVEQHYEISGEQIERNLTELRSLLDAQASAEEMIAAMRRFVPTYHDPNVVNACV